MSESRFRTEIEILTPVIINTGEIYEFCEIAPLEKVAYHIDPASIFSDVMPKESKTLIDELSNAIVERNNYKLCQLRAKLLSSYDFSNNKEIILLPKARATIKEKPMQEVSKIAIDPYYNKVYIPGSSVKGAIRTAVLEKIRYEKNIKQRVDDKEREEKGQNFEKRIIGFNNVEEDPFKYLKVSDFKFLGKGSGAAGLVYVGEIEHPKLTTYTAMSNAFCFHGQTVKVIGSISVDDRFFEKFPSLKGDSRELFSTVNDFYLEILNSPKIMDEFRNNSMRRIHSELQNRLNTEDNYIIRFGHHIGIQNYTFNVEQYKPPRKASHTINIDGGSISKVEGGYVPGICVLHISEF